MKKTCVLLLLTIVALGCGYTKPSNSMGGGGGTPTITSLMPNSATAGDPAFTTLTVNGSNFIGSSVVYWNATAKTTTFVTSGQLTVSMTPADTMNACSPAPPCTVQVYVRTSGGAYGGGVNSNMKPFTIN